MIRFIIVTLLALSTLACRDRTAPARADSLHARANSLTDSLPPWGTNGIPAMQEPSLLNHVDARDSYETYRFVWDRSFHRTVMIRIGRDQERAYLVKFVGSRDDSTAIGRRDSIGLSLAAWTELTQSLSQESFWRFPPPDIFPDGAMWMFERRSVRGYRYAVWHSPERSGRDSLAYATGVRLLTAAGLVGEEIY
jgi:hypothetical protein